jgi:superfamily II DNA or RNA helicase
MSNQYENSNSQNAILFPVELGVIPGEEEYKFRNEINQLIETNSISPEMLEIATRRIEGFNRLRKTIINEGHENLLDRRSHRQGLFLKDISRFFEEGKDAGFIGAATGVGKTVAFSKLIEATQFRTLLVVPTLSLVDQVESELAEWAPSRKISIVSSRDKGFDGDVVLTTYSSFIINVANGRFNPNDFDMLILDEFHEGFTPRRVEAIDAFRNSIKLGFSATPKRSVGLERIHEVSIQEAIMEGMLCGVKNVGVVANIDISGAINSGGDYDSEKLDKIILQNGVDRSAVELYKKLYYESEESRTQLLVNCGNIEHAERIVRMFREQGISAFSTHSRIDKDERRNIDSRFKNNEFSVLANVRTLTRGWSYTELDVVFNLVPTQSMVLATQRARVTRQSKFREDKIGTVVDWVYKDKNQILYAEVLGATEITIDKHIKIEEDLSDESKPTNPRSKGGQIEIEGFEVITDTFLLAELVRKRLDDRAEEIARIPENAEEWQYLNEIAFELKLNPRKVASLAEPFIQRFPEEVREMKTPNGRNTLFLSPELSSMFKSEVQKMLKLDEGWMNKNELSAKYETKAETIDKVIRRLASDNGISLDEENLRTKISPTGHTQSYYSPQLIELLYQHILIPEAPEGWYSANYLSESKMVIKQTFQKFIDRNTHLLNEENVKLFKHGRGGVATHYSQKILDAYLEDYGNVASLEWYTVNDISRLTGFSPGTIAKFLEQFSLEENPDLVSKKRTVSHNIEVPHYHSSLIDRFLEEYPVPLAEEGWIDLKSIADQLGSTYQQVLNSVNRNNIDTRYYRTPQRNQSKVHIRESDIELIRNHLKKDKE